MVTPKALGYAPGGAGATTSCTICPPDGRFAAIVDSEGRLVVDVDGSTANPRVLARNASSPAWSAWTPCG